jgi:F420-0:gamma-glutamyl ligase
MKVLPIRTERVEVNPSVNIEEWIVKSIELAGDEVREGDILVLSSKIVSYFEKSILKLSDIVPSEEAVLIAQRMPSRSWCSCRWIRPIR